MATTRGEEPRDHMKHVVFGCISSRGGRTSSQDPGTFRVNLCQIVVLGVRAGGSYLHLRTADHHTRRPGPPTDHVNVIHLPLSTCVEYIKGEHASVRPLTRVLMRDPYDVGPPRTRDRTRLYVRPVSDAVLLTMMSSELRVDP